MNTPLNGAYSADDDIVDFILGITFEIWEEGGVELIHQYYAQDSIVWGLDGITHSAAEIVEDNGDIACAPPFGSWPQGERGRQYLIKAAADFDLVSALTGADNLASELLDQARGREACFGEGEVGGYTAPCTA